LNGIRTKYGRWVGPYPERPDIFKLDTPANNIMYLQIIADNDFPSDIELYGNYTAPQPNNPIVKKNPLEILLGINDYE
jgi:endoglucanase